MLERYILLMFSVKRKGKPVGFDHIAEKAKRDLGVEEETVREVLSSLVERGLLAKKGSDYALTDSGRGHFASRFEEWRDSLLKTNRIWTNVYRAMRYYEKVGDVVLEYCRNRHVGFYCTFTEHVFFRRQFKGRYVTLNTKQDLLRFVEMFCIDVIPCVHSIGSERPDWLVIDLDAGPKLGFEDVKRVAEVAYEAMEKLEMRPAMKFSGSRGIQLWSKPKPFQLPEAWKPTPLLSQPRKRNYFSLFADLVRLVQLRVEEELPGLTTSVVCKKEERADKVLLDWSCLKPNGLVRAPYGIHCKTGLVSAPLSKEELQDFRAEDASPERVMEEYEERGNEFRLEGCDFSRALKELVEVASL